MIDHSHLKRVCVVFEKRPDGGLRVSSPDVPGFRRSHSHADLVTADIIPALEVIIGEMVGMPVRVTMPGNSLPLPESPLEKTTADYVAKLAA